MKSLYSFVFLFLACLLTACSAKDAIEKEAAAVSERAVAVKNHVTDAQADLKDASQGVTSVADRLTALRESSPDPNVESTLSPIVNTDLPDISRSLAAADARLDAAKTAAVDIKDRADTVREKVSQVEDRKGFFERLLGLGWVLVVTAIALALTVVAWRFGADKLVKSILSSIAQGIEWLSERFWSKWRGVAKLGVEADPNNPGSVQAFFAALREKVPGFDKAFKAVKEERKDAPVN